MESSSITADVTQMWP